MGVPKFYRWLSERYPCLSEVVKEHQIPEFDNLYLDMNGIIHNCSHPNDDDPHFRITEEKIFADIFHYIEVLFRMIQPQKVFFMAIDGVAPRAKMNQQRGRRFRSAKEAELSEKRARDRGEELPKDARFDSNCITPGTPFMVRLHEQLKYFVSMKISTDSLWQNVKVILSGHETPGEGEHKIMDFIRYEKSKPDYNPNIRHCLYGLDADLVMLGLCTHDPHFSLLREEVRFGGKKSASKRTVTPENTTFHLLHLSLLREYIDHEFSDLKMRQDLTFDYNVENIIDDWILLGFLVGNDFLPHLPNLHINKGALSDLFTTYKNILPSLGGYMNINGLLNLHRFELFLQALSEKELDHFEDIYSDAKWLEGKTSKKVHGFKNKVVTDTPGPAHVEEMLYENTAAARPSPSLEGEGWEVVSHQHKKDSDFMRLLKSADDFLLDSSDETVDLDSSDTDLSAFDHPSDPNSEPRDSNYHIEFRQHKREYYIRKLGYANVTADVLKEQAYGYVRAIQWNLHYYYNGCMSWSWYYQHHYAPWITDIRGFSDLEIKFEMGKPFLPFEQLLSVLPAASKELLPPLLQGLMINETSPIINYFPKDFESDLNGKQQEWEAVVLIPFIDQCKLQEAVQPLFSHLSKEEQGRNTHGPMLAYTYVSEPLGRYQAPQYFPDIDRNFANCREIWRKEFEVPLNKLNKGLMEGVRLDVYFPGFPTLKHIPHKARLGKENVKVFEQNSRGDNMMLYVRDDGVPDIHQVAEYLQGTEIWVSWPHMVEAKVIGLKNDKFTYTVTRNGSFVCNKNEPYEEENFNSSAKQISEVYKNRWGVVIGKTYIVVEACVMTGRKYVCGRDARITLEKLWSKTPQHFAFQTIRKDILVHDPSFTQYRTLPELFPSGSISYVLANPYYGCEATVLKIDKEHQGRIQLQVLEPIEPTLESVKLQESSEGSRYYPGYKAAQMLGISSHLLSRLTGSLYVLKGPKEAELEHAGRINIGLNLKNNKRNEEVCGFTRKSKDNNWVYSIRTIDVIRSYMGKYPEIFDYFSVADRVNGDHFHHGAIFLEGDGDEKLKELADWIRDLPCSTAGRQPCGTLTLDDAIVRGIEEEVTATHEAAHPKQQIVMQLKPHLIFKPNLSKGGCLPDPDADFLLFDRVVNVREGFSVPLGLRGTVIGLIKGTRSEDSPVEVLFDQEFHGGLNIRCTTGKAYRVPRAALINISYGARKDRHYDSNKEKHPSSSSNRPRAPKPHAAIPADDNNMQARRQRPGESIAYSKILRNSPAKDSSNLMSTAKHVTPPDPKNLPIPSDFLKQTIEDSNIDKDSSSIKKPNSMDMGELWTAVEQFDEQNQSSTNMNQNVANFFASHQQMQETQGGASSSNYGGGASANNFAGSPDKQNPFSGNANNFIPLQVQRSQARGGRGGQRGHGGRGNHQRNVVDSGVVTTGGPNNPSSQHHQPPPPPQHRGRGRGGRARSRGRGHLAANFTYQPSY